MSWIIRLLEAVLLGGALVALGAIAAEAQPRSSINPAAMTAGARAADAPPTVADAVVETTTVDVLSRLQQQAASLEFPAYLADRLAGILLWCEPRSTIGPGISDWAIASRVRYAYGFLAARAEQSASDQPERALELRRQAIWRLRIARDEGLKRIPAAHPALALAGSAVAASGVRAAGSAVADSGVRAAGSAAPGSQPKHAQTVYWTAAAWGALISLDREDLDLLADWPRAQAMANWLLREDPDRGEGAVRILAAGFELARPGGDTRRAREWLEEARGRFGDRQASVHLALADWVDLPEAREQGSGEALRRRLEEVLRVADRVPSMENTVAAARAAWLLSRIEDLF